MHPEDTVFIQRLCQIIDEMNEKAQACRAFDPLCEATYRIKIFYPTGEEYGEEKSTEGYHVGLDVFYSSGGSIETAIALNDKFSFILGKEKITHIVIEFEHQQEELEDMEKGEKGYENLVKKIYKFCVRVLPQEPEI